MEFFLLLLTDGKFPSNHVSMDEAPLFTRSQAQDLTLLDSQTLDYWTRLGILQPVAGGGGKGHHRKYDKLQITLGRIMKEMAEFGVGGSSLTKMAEEFQASIDWFAAKGLTDFAPAASSLIEYWHDLETKGFLEVKVADPVAARNDSRRIEKDDWAGLVAFHQSVAPLPDDIVLKCKSISFDEMREHFDRFLTLRPEGDGRSTNGDIFLFKNSDGGWEIDFEAEPKQARAFITIRLREIKRELWRRL